MKKLKPCPFCGSKAKCQEGDNENEGGYFIACTKCQASTNIRFATMDDVTDIVVESWNRRVRPTATRTKRGGS